MVGCHKTRRMAVHPVAPAPQGTRLRNAGYALTRNITSCVVIPRQTKEAAMKLHTAMPALSLALVLAACREPQMTSAPLAGTPLAQAAAGSGLVLPTVTGLALPLICRVGDVALDQTVNTNIGLVEHVVRQLVGLQDRRVPPVNGGVLGTDVVN